MSACLQIGLHRREDGSIKTSDFKVVYVAPMKALVAEMVGNFTKRLEKYDCLPISFTPCQCQLTKFVLFELQRLSFGVLSSVGSCFD